MQQTGGSLVSDAIGAITRLIRDRDLMPGDRLPSESALARELNVSRSVVREAFRSLSALRILDLGGGRRATVSAIDPGAIGLMIEHGVQIDQIGVQQVYDVRRTIETRIAALAAIRRSATEAQGLSALAGAMAASVGEPERLMELDLAFHASLAQASRNPLYALIIGAFEGITRQTWPLGWKSRPTEAARQRMLDTHAAIAAAVAAGDPAAAAAEMTVHFDESVKALVDAGMG